MGLTDFCTSARQSPVVVCVVHLAMGKFLQTVTCSLQGESRNVQTQFAKPNGGSAVWLSARVPIMHTKTAVITFAQILFFQFLDTIICVIFQKQSTFEATSRQSFEGRTHPHQAKETVLPHKYNAFTSSL